MTEPFIGEIRCVGFNYAPQGWEFCNGQTLQISQNAALYSLLGTTYGGNGTTTFQLPNLNVNVAGNSNSNTIRIVGGAQTTGLGKTTITNIPTTYTIPANVVRVILENP
jgi:microcystin-dependent protein